MPPEIRDKYKLKLPEFPGTSQCVQIHGAEQEAHRSVKVADMRQDESKMTGGIDESSILRVRLQQSHALSCCWAAC